MSVDGRVVLSGTLPGLLRRGSPVVCDEQSAVVVNTERRGRPCIAFFSGGLCGTGWRDADRVSLDLSQPEGFDRAARWLAEAVGLDVGATAPCWTREGGRDGVFWWELWDYANERIERAFASSKANMLIDFVAPGISEVTDPAEALKLACLAVAALEAAPEPPCAGCWGGCIECRAEDYHFTSCATDASGRAQYLLTAGDLTSEIRRRISALAIGANVPLVTKKDKSDQ